MSSSTPSRMPSEDSSVHDRCGQCPHERRHHGAGRCILCSGFDEVDRHDFVVEPPGSASSSPDDKCTCGCTRTAHMGKPYGCLVHGFHGFAPAEPDPAEEPYCPHACAEGHTYSGSCALRAYGPPPVSAERLAEMRAEDAECQHRDAYQITGDKLGRPGRRMGYVCETCGEVWMKTAPKAAVRRHDPLCPGLPETGYLYCNCPTQPASKAQCAAPKGHCADKDSCQGGCRWAADELSQQTQDMEPEALECECPDGWWASGEAIHTPGCPRTPEHRRETPPEGWSDCGFAPESPGSSECGVERGCVYDRSTCAVQCKGVLDAVKRAVQAPSLRRPPYAVAYAIEGGAQYEIALPGDASVRAEDGALIVTHDSAVLALSHVRPMEGQ